jgi:DNA-binding MarR family transcriptional regulator
MVDRLVAAGLVGRERFDGDARVMLAHLTDDGRRRVHGAARTHLRGIREHFTEKLNEDQQRALGEILEAITGPHRPH